MPAIAKKTTAPAPAPAAKAPAKKTAKAAPAPSYNVGDIITFGDYETEQENPLLFPGDYLRVTEIDKTKKGRVRYHVQPITADEEGNPRLPDTAFAEELRPATEEEQDEIATLLAQSDEEGEGEGEGEDYAALGDSADNGDEAAAARLTELCGELGLDPEAYASWAEAAAAIAETAVGGEDEDLEALAAEADAGDEAAAARLTELAGEHEVDPEAYASWADVARVLNGEEVETAGEGEQEQEQEQEAPAPAKAPAGKAPAGKAPAAPAKKTAGKAPASNGKKGNTSGTRGKTSIAMTPTMQAVLTETNQDLLAAMQQTEKQIGQTFLDLGGLIKMGELAKIHLAIIDEETGKPKYEDSAKGYYSFVAENLETEERVARHLAKAYFVFVHKLKFDPESIIQLGISKLREISSVALKLNKADSEANKAAGITDPEAEGYQNSLEDFLQESATLTVKDVVHKVRALKSGGEGGGGGNGSGGGAGGVIGQKIVTMTIRAFSDRASFMQACIEAAMSDLPDAEKNQDAAVFKIFQDYATSAGLPEFVPAPAPKATAKAPAKKTAAPAPAAPAKKAAAPAPVAKKTTAPAPAKKVAAKK